MPANSKKPIRPRRAADGEPLRVPLTAEQLAALANHPEPSAGSLRKVPPVNIETALTFGRGPEAMRAGFEYLRAKRGRPKKGEASPGSATKTLRLTAAEWAALEALASKRHTTLHALLRKAARRELAESAAVPAKARRRKAG